MAARATLLLCSTLAVAGCLPSSPSSDFFMLEPDTGDDVQQRPLDQTLSVEAVVLPPELERSELVRYPSAGQVELLETKRWAAPLDDLVYRTLVLNLAARLDNVVLPGQPKPTGPVRSLDVVVEQFGAGPANELTLRTHWTVSDEEGEPVIQRNTRIGVPLPDASPNAIAAAMSRALAHLADEIANVLAHGGRG